MQGRKTNIDKTMHFGEQSWFNLWSIDITEESLQKKIKSSDHFICFNRMTKMIP